MKSVRKQLPRWLVALPIAMLLSTGLQAETVARYGISMADIPLTTGQPDRGADELVSSASLENLLDALLCIDSYL